MSPKHKTNQTKLMQGAKILFFNLQLILLLNLVINVQGFKGFN